MSSVLELEQRRVTLEERHRARRDPDPAAVRYRSGPTFGGSQELASSSVPEARRNVADVLA